MRKLRVAGMALILLLLSSRPSAAAETIRIG